MTKKFCIILLNIYIYKDFDIILWIFAQLCERKFGGEPALVGRTEVTTNIYLLFLDQSNKKMERVCAPFISNSLTPSFTPSLPSFQGRVGVRLPSFLHSFTALLLRAGF